MPAAAVGTVLSRVKNFDTILGRDLTSTLSTGILSKNPTIIGFVQNLENGKIMRPSFSSYADSALNTLIGNWYQSGSGSWRDLGWWNSANALETVIDYSFSRSLGNVNAIIWDVFNNSKDKYGGNFITNYYDDEAWWGLALVKAFDRTQSVELLNTAEIIFEDMLTGWDEEVCSGGVWWNKTRREKNAIENELFITLATRLFLRTNKSSYFDWANRAWNWFDQTGMQGPSGLINDGVDLNTCGSNGKPAWSYNQGVILGGLADLHRITGEISYLKKARQIASAAMNLLVDDKGILRDPCESSPDGCGADGPQFKGIFVRYLSYLYSYELEINGANPRGVVPSEDIQFLSSCKTFLARQAVSIWSNDRDNNNTLGLHWAGPHTGASASTQSSALDALVAAIPF